MIATDRDIGPNAMLFYYITAGNQDLTFRMDRVTGEMVTRPAPPDRERQQEYRLTVTVEDDGTPPLSVRYKEQQLQQVEHFTIYLNISHKQVYQCTKKYPYKINIVMPVLLIIKENNVS